MEIIYNSWLYQNVINTSWFMRTLVYFVLVCNLLVPIFIWYLMSGKQKKMLGVRMDTSKQKTNK